MLNQYQLTPVDPIPRALVDIPNKSLVSRIANTGELLVNLKLGTIYSIRY